MYKKLIPSGLEAGMTWRWIRGVQCHTPLRGVIDGTGLPTAYLVAGKLEAGEAQKALHYLEKMQVAGTYARTITNYIFKNIHIK